MSEPMACKVRASFPLAPTRSSLSRPLQPEQATDGREVCA